MAIKFFFPRIAAKRAGLSWSRSPRRNHITFTAMTSVKQNDFLGDKIAISQLSACFSNLNNITLLNGVRCRTPIDSHFQTVDEQLKVR